MSKALKTFTLSEEHIKLLRHMYVGWQQIEFGAPEINPNRPYGNSDALEDIAKILGHTSPNDIAEPHLSRERSVWLEELHHEMETVLQILLLHGNIRPGEYIKQRSYDSLSWEEASSKEVMHADPNHGKTFEEEPWISLDVWVPFDHAVVWVRHGGRGSEWQKVIARYDAKNVEFISASGQDGGTVTQWKRIQGEFYIEPMTSHKQGGYTLLPHEKWNTAPTTEAKLIKLRCAACGRVAYDVKYQIDPYIQDIGGREEWRNLCPSCLKDLQDDI